MACAINILIFFSVFSSIIGQSTYEKLPLRFDLALERSNRLKTRPMNPPFEMESAEILMRNFVANNQSDECTRDLQLLMNATIGQEFWALKILDSWGKPLPAGILNGNNFWIGNFDECVHLYYNVAEKSFVPQPFQTQHCKH